MLQRFLGGNSRRRRRRKEEEEAKRVELLRDISALRKTCNQNIESAYSKCQEGVRQDDPLMSRMAVYNASLLKSNETVLRKCDRTLLNMQTGDLRRKGAIADHLNQTEFNDSYRQARKSSRKSNVSKLRRRALKMEKYRSMQNSNRALINDSLRDDLADMFEEDEDSDDDDSDAVEFVNSIKEKHLIDSVLAAPNPTVTTLDRDEMRNDTASEIHDDV